MKVRYFTVMHSLITKIQVYIVSLTKRYMGMKTKRATV